MKLLTRWTTMWALVLLPAAGLYAGDWTQWGGNSSRNMASTEKNIPASFGPGEKKAGSEEIDMATTKGVKWVAKLGSQAYGNVTISGGLVFVGTNNESARDPKHKGDKGNIYCFDEKTGAFQWQLVVPKLGAGKVSDWEFLGICSSPAVDGDKVYLVTNRCEVVCLDVKGLANGNQGYADEAKFMAEDGQAVEPTKTDADILWRFDMREELGVFPHNIASSSVLIHGDALYVTTSNGLDWSHVNIPSPQAPALISLNKNTGELIGEESSGISKRILHCNWSSPAFAKVGEQEMVVFGAGDGWTYGFDPKPVEDEEGFMVFKEIWKLDCIPAEYRTKDGKPIKYATGPGPSEIISTPVVYKNRVYVAIGQDPEHGEGVGALSCIDASKTGDITKSGLLWRNQELGRSISTASISNGRVYLAEYSGKVHCFDAENGKRLWTHDTKSHIWGSTYAVDGKVFLGTEDGDLWVYADDAVLKIHDPASDQWVDPTTDAGKQLKPVNVGAPVYGTPVVANGVLYVQSQTHLYAIGK